MRVFLLIWIILLCPVIDCMSQATLPVVDPFGKNKPVINTPNTPTISIAPNSRNRISPHDPTKQNKIVQQNAALIQEVQEFEYQNTNIRRQKDIQMLITNGFPMQSDNEGTGHYYFAFKEIDRMLKGEIPMNLGRAIFLVENAYHSNKYDYIDFQNGIKDAVNLCEQKIKEEKLDKEDNLVKNLMLFRYISDTLTWKDKKTGKNLYHYPVKYNYEDYHSKISYDSHFITTLMQTGKGQCYSMPLYYLVLAEEIGAEAYWSFSPRHSFVKIQDEEGLWYNLELTCKAILSDAHYMNNSYIKAEAIQNRIYLEPMDKTNVIAHMLIELARGYYQKYGLDDFYLKCADTAIEYTANNLEPLMLKSFYQTRLTLTLGHLLQAKNPEIMKGLSPEAYKHYEKMQALYNQIDDLGYEELPEDLYTRWLDHIAKEKEKSEKLPSIFIRTPKE